MNLEAKKENLARVLSFVDGCLEAAGCSAKAQMQIEIAVEEIFVNIANYAYAPDSGDVEITVDIAGKPAEAVIEFRDRGAAFDPLAKPDPDVTLSAAERQVGGLGIYMVKKSMDSVAYTRENGQNVLTLRKGI